MFLPLYDNLTSQTEECSYVLSSHTSVQALLTFHCVLSLSSITMATDQYRAGLRVATESSRVRTHSPLQNVGDSLKWAMKAKWKENNIHSTTCDPAPNPTATAPSRSSSRISVPAPCAWQSETNLWELARIQVLDDTGVDEAIKGDLRIKSYESNSSEVIKAAEDAKNHYQGEQRTYTKSSGEKKSYQDTVNNIV